MVGLLVVIHDAHRIQDHRRNGPKDHLSKEPSLVVRRVSNEGSGRFLTHSEIEEYDLSEGWTLRMSLKIKGLLVLTM